MTETLEVLAFLAAPCLLTVVIETVFFVLFGYRGKDTLIVCSLGSMDYFLYDRLKAAVEEYKADTGDERVFAFKYLPINNMSEGVGAGGHPSMKTHLRMGKELAFRLRPWLGK